MDPVNGEVFTQQNEGYMDVVYDDATGEELTSGSEIEGYPTIGWGLRADLPFSDESLGVEFRDRYAAAKRDTRDVIPGFDNLDPARQAAFTDMCYHMGKTGLGLFKAMIGHIPEAIRTGDWEDVVTELLDSDYARYDTPNRAERVATLLLEGSE